MRKYFRQAGYFAAILILLPYVVTILLNGRSSLAQDNGTSPYVTVKSDEKNRKISLDEYGIGILAKEIEGDAEEEALKAQAVLIRTSIYKSIQDEGTSTVLTKEYWTRQQMESNWGADHYGEYYEKMKAAWDETRGQVLMYDGRLILTPYHRLSNGKTRSGNEVFGSEEYPYLQSRECPEDVEAKEEMTVSMIQGSDMEVTGTDNAGYVTEVRCGSETVNGEELQKITENAPLKIGDKVTVRMILNTDRNMEFIHLKDMRAAGFEPVDVLSGYQWKNNLGYYQVTKDASTNFYIEYMPKGKYVFEYDYICNAAGTFSNGITTMQNYYAPQMNAHTQGTKVSIQE